MKFIGRIRISFQIPSFTWRVWTRNDRTYPYISGDWLTVVAHAQKYFDGGHQQLHHRPQLSCTSFYDEFKVQVFWAMAIGYGIYFGFCGYLEVSVIRVWCAFSTVRLSFFNRFRDFPLQWKYYVKRRGQETQWKCQPNRHLPRHLFWDQIKWGCIGLVATNAVSAAVATHVKCGGFSKVYIAFGQYPWWWWILQWPVIFLQQVGCILYWNDNAIAGIQWWCLMEGSPSVADLRKGPQGPGTPHGP